jgi:hypothetical protein
VQCKVVEFRTEKYNIPVLSRIITSNFPYCPGPTLISKPLKIDKKIPELSRTFQMRGNTVCSSFHNYSTNLQQTRFISQLAETNQHVALTIEPAAQLSGLQ